MSDFILFIPCKTSRSKQKLLFYSKHGPFLVVLCSFHIENVHPVMDGKRTLVNMYLGKAANTSKADDIVHKNLILLTRSAFLRECASVTPNFLSEGMVVRKRKKHTCEKITSE